MGNSALYGSINASYPLRLKLSKATLSLLNDSNSLMNMPTGILLPIDIEIEICDIYNQKITVLNDGFISLGLIQLNNTNDINYQNIKGTLAIKIKNGSVIFNEIIIFSNPTDITLGLAFSSPLINQNLYKNQFNNINFTSYEYILDNTYYFVLPTHIRNCIPGEIYDDSISSCSKCPTNTFSLSTNDFKCRDCYKYADCYGGMNLSLHIGYWRSSIYSDDIFPCEPYSDSCL